MGVVLHLPILYQGCKFLAYCKLVLMTLWGNNVTESVLVFAFKFGRIQILCNLCSTWRGSWSIDFLYQNCRSNQSRREGMELINLMLANFY